MRDERCDHNFVYYVCNAAFDYFRPLGSENLLLRGATLKNTEYIHGNKKQRYIFMFHLCTYTLIIFAVDSRYICISLCVPLFALSLIVLMSMLRSITIIWHNANVIFLGNMKGRRTREESC